LRCVKKYSNSGSVDSHSYRPMMMPIVPRTNTAVTDALHIYGIGERLQQSLRDRSGSFRRAALPQSRPSRSVLHLGSRLRAQHSMPKGSARSCPMLFGATSSIMGPRCGGKFLAGCMRINPPKSRSRFNPSNRWRQGLINTADNIDQRGLLDAFDLG